MFKQYSTYSSDIDVDLWCRHRRGMWLHLDKQQKTYLVKGFNHWLLDNWSQWIKYTLCVGLRDIFYFHTYLGKWSNLTNNVSDGLKRLTSTLFCWGVYHPSLAGYPERMRGEPRVATSIQWRKMQQKPTEIRSEVPVSNPNFRRCLGGSFLQNGWVELENLESLLSCWLLTALQKLGWWLSSDGYFGA